MRRLRIHLTYANVVASLALFIALAGGSAFAASQILPKNSVGSGQIKKAAVTPEKLSASAKATLTGPAGAVGPRGPGGEKGERGEKGETGAPATTLWAEVSGEGALRKGSGVTGVELVSPGFYYVHFARDVSACTYLPSMTTYHGEAVAEGAGGNTALVETFNSTGTTREDRRFALVVIC